MPVATSGPGAGFGRVTFCAHGAPQMPVTASRRDMRPFGLRMERRILIRHFAPLQPKQTASPNPKMRPTSHDSKVSCPIMSTNRNIHNTGRQSQSQVVPLQGDLPILWWNHVLFGTPPGFCADVLKSSLKLQRDGEQVRTPERRANPFFSTFLSVFFVMLPKPR